MVSIRIYRGNIRLPIPNSTEANLRLKEEKGLGWLVYFAVGTQLGVSIVAGLLLGHFVDKWIGTKTPWFTFIGLIAGVISGFSLLIRIIKRKDDDESN